MDYNTTPQSKKTIQSLWRLEKIILESLDFNDVVQKIVDSVLLELGYLKLGYKIVVLALIDKDKKFLKRVSISKTDEAKKALSITPIPFHEINIPLSAASNISVKAVTENKSFTTSDWRELLCPPYTPDEAMQVQNAIGIKNSMVFPVISKNKAIGVLIFSMVKEKNMVSEEEMDLIKSFTDVVGLAVQNSTLYSSLEKTSKDLKEANEKLKQLDKLKDEFVSLASHELRTPMTIIKSYLWMFLSKNKGKLPEKESKYLERAYESTERLINLVNDMLNVSRIESGRLKLDLRTLSIVDLVRKVVTELTPRAKQLSLNLTFTDTGVQIPMVYVDSERVEQVLINIIGNSLKFTPAGGSISLSLTSQRSSALIQITDNGKGMNDEVLQKLFQKFSTMGGNYLRKQEGQGTGLGLYLSKSLIELQGGKIWAQSAGENKGSTFSFSVPYANIVHSQTVPQEAVRPSGGGLEPHAPGGAAR